jgi:NADH:ubiquinone oxidoreductase subunit E
VNAASCRTGPVMIVNDEFYEQVTPDKAEAILAECM